MWGKTSVRDKIRTYVMCGNGSKKWNMTQLQVIIHSVRLGCVWVQVWELYSRITNWRQLYMWHIFSHDIYFVAPSCPLGDSLVGSHPYQSINLKLIIPVTVFLYWPYFIRQCSDLISSNKALSVKNIKHCADNNNQSQACQAFSIKIGDRLEPTYQTTTRWQCGLLQH
jgi:hypothetical protein